MLEKSELLRAAVSGTFFFVIGFLVGRFIKKLGDYMDDLEREEEDAVSSQYENLD